MANNPIIDGLEYEPADGAISREGVRYLLLRPETLVTIQRIMEEELGDGAARILFDAGRAGGASSAKRFREADPDSPGDELFRTFCRLGSSFGWGSLHVIDGTDDGVFEIEVTNSALAAVYGDSRVPVCHLLRGVLAGIGEILLDTDVIAVELRCRAVDGEPCTFRIRPDGSPLRFRNEP